MGRRKKTSVPNLICVLDFGGSMTKIFFGDLSGKCSLLCMEPEVMGMPESAIASYKRTLLGSADQKDSAYVGVGNDYYAVGYLAQTQFFGNAGLSEPKYERALPKTLAAVWVAGQHLTLGNQFNVAIGVLLPPGEYEDRERFEALLRSALARYETPTGMLKVNLSQFNCKPEGGGIYLMYCADRSTEVKRSVCAVVMVGYRNASVLVSNRGQVGQLKTSNLGFIRMVELVQKRSSGLEATALAEAIALAGEQVDIRPLRGLFQDADADLRREKVDKLSQVIKEVRIEYAAMLESWLKEALPQRLDEVILCGGTADYLHRELNEHFPATPIIWHADIDIPEELDISEMGNRLADVYGMYLYFTQLLQVQLAHSLEVSCG